MKKEVVNSTMNLDTLHRESRNWISQLEFSQDEINFFIKLLNSYVFEPDTPALFEDLQSHQKNLSKAEKKCKALKKQVLEHENQLSGLLDLHNHTLDAAYKDKHMYLKEDMEQCTAEFLNLKKEMFRYGQTILKKRHNKDR
ncbi:hypothetical protein SAMN06265375_1011417 [Muriicola jejuensis]|uniref:Uncharacterized protein n=1 Tax=Muriicola jejuensis TaxID=504488 RepID=A0A6P0UB17_9FLAO|nr:hypothetical protein [Muriicola jejuensis]NER09099.1 hypothetical protein [Muriicola jejuensis]SMP11135.1 hypothetical protein SAMN06265375_1011417 [Muriicola jejuensis]